MGLFNRKLKKQVRELKVRVQETDAKVNQHEHIEAHDHCFECGKQDFKLNMVKLCLVDYLQAQGFMHVRSEYGCKSYCVPGKPETAITLRKNVGEMIYVHPACSKVVKCDCHAGLRIRKEPTPPAVTKVKGKKKNAKKGKK